MAAKKWIKNAKSRAKAVTEPAEKSRKNHSPTQAREAMYGKKEKK